MLKNNGEGIVQTTNRKGSENCSSKHNLEVVGSCPTPRTIFKYFFVFLLPILRVFLYDNLHTTKCIYAN